ncbi:N-acetylglucosamine/diacetylchitobiose ABC transporter substrate-binding protein [Streptomyces sp. NBC_00887]|uniref:N-acetylglucosamine/diacetylchitobiose ABC transporter substrate-binding protein n=1 Tax=Streptomyces sp. NBC_00887 TaxID=2975859 RepID=UPI003864C95C|nr:N-acetylglucosamine/diacetylchitobiose ABC transporter substrate-binding protein [Streptomyces sp. NBC_00887]WSY36282.1 N-acetylglucosamine/diacetylchitobiose ABC transporter substrate-binding protein [Streptomyces sp. NBC_00887]
MSRNTFIDRRAMLRGAAALVAAGGVAALTGCATGGEKSPAPTKSATKNNPLGVPDDAGLNVVIFKGGYGDQWAKFVEDLYSKRYPDAKVDLEAIQQVAETLQPRFVGGNPPDLADAPGLGIASLVTQKQLLDLAPLLDAPSVDNPSIKVRDTLLPGVVEGALFDGKVYQLNYITTVFGFCYSKSLFAKHGWVYPKTWDEMLALCAEIKDAGVAPWTYQGKHPGYWTEALMAMATKAGGRDVVKAIDNLEPKAWKNPAVLEAAEAIYEIAKKGYLLPGTAALTHTEAQTAWAKGQAAFIPCGTWIENEMKGIIPDGFDTVIAPTPSLTSRDVMPQKTVYAKASESFIVPAQGSNPRGGMEFLRLMLSKEASQNFARTAGSMTVLKGGSAGVTLSPGVESARDSLEAAGDNVVLHTFSDWYPQLQEEVASANGELMTLAITPKEWAARCQKAADKIAADSSIAKFTR